MQLVFRMVGAVTLGIAVGGRSRMVRTFVAAFGVFRSSSRFMVFAMAVPVGSDNGLGLLHG